MGLTLIKNTWWRVAQLKWTFLSILLIIPLPIHIHPLVMMHQGAKAKVRKWYMYAWIFLLIELGILVSFIHLSGLIGMAFTSAFSLQAFATVGFSIISCILGNGMLLNQSKNYIKRLELAKVRPLVWISSIENDALQQTEILSVETGDSFVNKLVSYRQSIRNRAIQEHIDKIIRLFQLLESKDRMESEKFLVRHGTVVNVLREYDLLEKTQLNNKVTLESKNKLEAVILQASLAIETDVTNIIKARLLDVSVESDVYLQTLRNRDLLKSKK